MGGGDWYIFLSYESRDREPRGFPGKSEKSAASLYTGGAKEKEGKVNQAIISPPGESESRLRHHAILEVGGRVGKKKLFNGLDLRGGGEEKGRGGKGYLLKIRKRGEGREFKALSLKREGGKRKGGSC